MAKTILPEHVSNSLLKRMRICVALKKLLSVPHPSPLSISLCFQLGFVALRNILCCQ